jgi:double-stranded uracil-DNA glycosylase
LAPAIYAGGFSDRLLSPFEEKELLARGYGITNVVSRATARADELSPEEYVQGAKQLTRKIRRFRPRAVAVLGISAYRIAFNKPLAALGQQTETIGGSALWILPNPSGLNAHYQPKELARIFAELRHEVEMPLFTRL